MERAVEFIGNHPALCLAFVAILVTLVWTFVQGAMQGVRKVTPQDATRLINQEDAVVLDLRPDAEYRQGHIINAVHVPADQLGDQLGKLGKYRGRPVIATCRSGQQSNRAGAVLRKNGFEKVFALGGGILAWEGASLPLTKK